MTDPGSEARVPAVQRNDPTFANIVDELAWRGIIAVSTDLDAIRARVGRGPVTVYCGFDPTAPSLHLGNLVQLLLLRRLQLAGNDPIGLVGGSTGLIGDPRPTAERTLNSREVVAAWAERVHGQIERYLDFGGEHPARIANNLDWTSDLSAIDFLRDVGKHFRVGAMLKKDAVAARLNSAAGISYTEFSYQILQAYDFAQLYERFGCELQTGGQDQWGNLVGGVDLLRRTRGVTVHALGTPLILNADGTKFGKTEGNAIWIDPALTSAYEFYQFWRNTDDRDVVDRLKIFTFLTRDEIDAYAEKVAAEPHRRAAQQRLAFEVTSLVHGADAAEAAVRASRALFGDGDLASLDVVTVRAAVAELPSAQAHVGGDLLSAIAATGLVRSLGEGRRSIAQGGLYRNNQRIEDADARISPEDLLPGGYIVVRKGKRTLATIRVDSAR